MSYTDERIVKMTFDHSAFNKDIDTTIKNLRALDDALNLDNAAKEYKVFDNLTKSADGVYDSMGRVESAVGKVEVAFSKLQVIGMKVLWDLMDTAKSFGASMYQNTLGTIISKGMNRSLNLEQAKFQLEGMKVSWDEIKGDIDYAVDKTAYGLDSAAKVASQLVASNIKTGSNMKNALRGISGVAAMTNSSYEEIGHIFTTVAANDRLMTENIRQLSIRGLNVSANMLGYFKDIKGMSDITEQSLNDMVAKGKIHFQDFANAMDYAFGEHAKEANSTFTGALSNMQAALGRVGEIFQTPKMQFLTKVYNNMIDVINTLKKALVPVAEMYGSILNKTSLWVENILKSRDLHQIIIKLVASVYTWMFAIGRAAEAAGLKLPAITTALQTLNKAADNLILTGEKYAAVKKILTAIFGIVATFKNLLQSVWYVVEPLFTEIGKYLGIVITDADSAAEAFSKFLRIINIIIVVIAKLLRSGLIIFLQFLPVIAKAAELAFIGLGIAILTVADKISKAVTIIKEFVSSFKMDSVANGIADASTSVAGFGGIIVSVFSKGIDLAKSFGSIVSTGFKTLFDNIFKSSDIAKDKAVDVSKSMGGAVGGKFLKGQFGMNNGLIDTTKALDHYKNAIEEASEEEKEKEKSFGTGMFAAMEANRDKVSKMVDENPDSPGGAAYDYITGMFPFLRYIADKSTVSGVIDKAFAGFMSILGNLKEHFSEPMNWVKDGAIGAAVVAGVAFMTKVKKFMDSGKEAGEAATGAGSSLVGLSKVLWSVAGIILAMGAVAKFVKAEDFRTVSFTIVAMISAFAVMLRGLITLRKVSSMADAISGLAKALDKGLKALIQVNGNIKVTVKKVVSSMAEILHELISMIGIFLVSIVTIVVLSKAFDIKMEDFITASVIIVAGVLSLVLGLVIINNILMASQGSMKKTTASLQKSKKFFSLESDSAAISIASIMASVTGLMLSFALSTAVLASYRFEKVVGAGATILIGTMLMVGTILGIMLFATKVIYKQRKKGQKTDQIKKDNEETAKIIDTFMDSFKEILKAMKKFIKSLSFSMRLIIGFSPEQMWSAMGALTLSLSGVVGLITYMIWFANKMAREFKGTENADKVLTSMSKMMTKAMISMSVLVIALGVAMRIVGGIDYNNLVPAAITFGIIVAVVSGLLVAISWGLKQISDSALLLTLNEDQMKTINKTLKTVSIIFAEMIIGIIVIAGTFAAISKLVSGIKDTSTILVSAGIMLMAVGSMILLLIAITELTKKMPETSAVVKLAGMIGSILLLLGGITLVMNMLSKIDWSGFKGSEPYLIGFGIAIAGLMVIFAGVAKIVNAALTGVIGVSVVILAIGTLAIMIGVASSIFADSIVKLKDAFIELSRLDGDKAKETMSKLKDTIAIFTECMSHGMNVLASAMVFSTAMFLMGAGMKTLSTVDAETMKYTVEALKLLFQDMKSLIGLAWTGVAVSVLFGIIGASLATGAVGFLIFGVIMSKAIDLVVPILGKLAGVLTECQTMFKDFKMILSKKELDTILVGLAELFVIGAVMGLAAGTLAVSSAVFLAGIGLLYLASKYYAQVMENFKKSLSTISGTELWEIMKDMATLTLTGLFMSLAAGILLGGVLGLLAASAIGIAAAKVLQKFLKELYKAFTQIKLGVIFNGCLEILGAAVILGIASGVMLLGAIPFMAAMALFGIGLFMLTANIAILGYGLGLLADALNSLATVESDKVMAAVDTVVMFVEKLNEALTMASENFDEEKMGAFGDGMLALSGKLLLSGVMLPLAGAGLLIGAALLSGAMKVMKDAFTDMDIAYQAMNMETIGALINNLNVFTQSLSEFVVDFMLYDLAFAAGAGLFAAAAWLLEKGLGFMNEATTKYDAKKILAKVKPITDIGNVFVKFSGQMLASGIMLTIAGLAISWAVSELLEQVRQATQDIPPFVEVVSNAIDVIAEKVKVAKEIGKDVTDGLVIGMTAGSSLVFEKGYEIATGLISWIRDGAKTHSASTETTDVGEDVDQGLVDGMENGEKSVLQKGKDLATGLLNAIEDPVAFGKDKLMSLFSNLGIDLADASGGNFLTGFLSYLKSAAVQGGGIIGSLVSMFDTGMSEKRASLLQRRSGLEQTKNAASGKASQTYINNINDQITDINNQLAALDQEESLLGGGIDKLLETLGLKDLFDDPLGTSGGGLGGGGYEPDYSSANDLTANAASLGKGTGGSDLKSARSAGNGVGTSITNNTYNFVQNNYSPEPIDRTELYLQTNNQLNTWYKWLRST